MLRTAIRRLRSLAFGMDAPTYVPDRIYLDDVFIVSYPKSGNTWMRFLIGNYLTGNECTFENCHLITPDIHMNPEHCAEVDRPRFIKSHAPYRPQYPNVVYLARDGRDVAVSYYHHCIRKGWIDSGMSFPTFLQIFNKGEVDDFGIWGEHVTAWIEQANQLLLVRYQDLLEDAEAELRRVLDFGDLEVEETALKSAVEASTFENMKKEEEDHREKTGLPDGDPTEKFMRKGKQGNWKKYFDEDTHERFLDANEEALELIYKF